MFIEGLLPKTTREHGVMKGSGPFSAYDGWKEHDGVEEAVLYSSSALLEAMCGGMLTSEIIHIHFPSHVVFFFPFLLIQAGLPPPALLPDVNRGDKYGT